MAIDLSVLISGASTTTSTMSPMAMYKKLQKVAEENSGASEVEQAKAKADAATREIDNAAIRVRNKQYKLQNAQVQDDTFYYKNRVATATTVDELINDDRFLKVLAYANGFEDMYNGDRQRLRDILRSDMTDPNSVARTGSVKELELALKYNFGASGDQYDVNGNLVTVTDDGKLTNTGEGTALAAGLAKLRGLVIDPNGNAAIDPDTTKLVLTAGPSASDTTIYSRSQTKALLQEKTAPEESGLNKVYEFDGAEFQRFRERKDVQKEIEYFKENIGSVETVDEFFESRNHRLLKFVLSAYDLESEAQYPGKIRKILESDLTDIDSLANRFKDPRFLQLTKDLNLNATGMTRLKLASTAEDLATRYERIAYEKNLDEQAPGVRAAIEFNRRIKDVTLTSQLLGDTVMREVITVANNIPKEIAYQEVESQVTAVERKVDLNSLKSDQNEIEKMVMRYLTFKDGGFTGASSKSYLTNLFG
ncbi:MAG: DUF1217 domain-containing protein [Alphaproteobacteria bacterium]|nr:DUF1217 domain-containing protein [Alphaproteobacteria bacterium]